MQRMIKKIMCGLVLCSASTGSMAAACTTDTKNCLVDSISLDVQVEVLRPVCKLNSISDGGTINFGEFSAWDIVTGHENIKKKITFDFTECSNVNKLNISFMTQPRKINNNYIPNQTGDDMAKGIGVSLFRATSPEGTTPLNLNQTLSVNTTDSDVRNLNNGTHYEWDIIAKVVRTYSGTEELITAGKLDTQVSMMITYE